MFGAGVISPLGALGALAVLIIWIIILVWLAERIFRFIGIRTAWGHIDPRNVLSTFVLLVGAIHFGNYAIDLIESSVRETSYEVALAFPGAFLIGSVATGVGIAAVRCWRKQKSDK